MPEMSLRNAQDGPFEPDPDYTGVGNGRGICSILPPSGSPLLEMFVFFRFSALFREPELM